MPDCPVCHKPLVDGIVCLGEWHDVAPHQLGDPDLSDSERAALDELQARTDALVDAETRALGSRPEAT
jgi:hypothetical protein